MHTEYYLELEYTTHVIDCVQAYVVQYVMRIYMRRVSQ